MFKPTPRSVLSHSNRKTIFGVGINDADYITHYTDSHGTKHKCPYYVTWKGMLQRCFDPKLHAKHPTYVQCTVDPDWLLFSNFKKWMETQDWQGKCLDKDLLSQGSSHYSAATCIFISPLLNALLTYPKKARQLPLGVSKKKDQDYFIASCSFYGKQKQLGYFKTVDEASAAYKAAKRSYILELARKESDSRLVHALVTLTQSPIFT